MRLQLGPRKESLSSYPGQDFLPAIVVWVHGGERRAVAGNGCGQKRGVLGWGGEKGKRDKTAAKWEISFQGK